MDISVALCRIKNRENISTKRILDYHLTLPHVLNLETNVNNEFK